MIQATASCLVEAGVYERPFLYDLAFAYRDFPAEVGLLLAWYARGSGRERPRKVLELAAGPADHARELARRGVAATALDLSPAMCRYAAEKATRQGVPLRVVCGDMVDFHLEERFDLAIQMINSVAHLQSLEAMVSHLQAVAAHLEEGGCYILEMQHPADFLGRTARPFGISRPWRVARDGVELEVQWGRESDPYDSLTGVFEASVELHLHDGDREEVIHETCRMKDWTAGELQAALRLAGCLEVAEAHGDFAFDAPLDGSPRSWRMIQVLRKGPRLPRPTGG